jgi:hypothetical protein
MRAIVDFGDWAYYICSNGHTFDVDPTTEDGCKRVYDDLGRITLIPECPVCGETKE